jgi:WD40 repeat protein
MGSSPHEIVAVTVETGLAVVSIGPVRDSRDVDSCGCPFSRAHVGTGCINPISDSASRKRDVGEQWPRLCYFTDGRSLAFVGASADGIYRIWIRPLNALEAHPLLGTEEAGDAQGNGTIFWSPDSRYLAFATRQTLKKIDVAGGPAQVLCSLDSSKFVVGGAWSREGVIVFGYAGNSLFRMLDTGGPCTPLTTLNPPEDSHMFPSLFPDGKKVLYFTAGGSTSGQRPNETVYVRSLDAPRGGNGKMIMSTPYAALYVPYGNSRMGRLLFVRDRTLLAQPFDPDRLELTGEAVPVAEQIGILFNDPFFSASMTGVLAYRTTAIERYELIWFDRQGHIIGKPGQPAFYREVAVARDGKRAVYGDHDTGALWMLDLVRGTKLRLTEEFAESVVLSPDGDRVAYGSDFPRNLYQKRADGAKGAELLLKSPENKLPLDWSRDGRVLLYRADNAKTKSDLWALLLDGDRKSFPVLQTQFDEPEGQFSPDGRWLAYTSKDPSRVWWKLPDGVTGC